METNKMFTKAPLADEEEEFLADFADLKGTQPCVFR